MLQIVAAIISTAYFIFIHMSESGFDDIGRKALLIERGAGD